MKMTEEFNQKILVFATAIQDVYKDEENKERQYLPKLDLSESTFTEDFTAMIYALYTLFKSVTGDESTDIIGFTHILNRLVVQDILNNKEESQYS